MYARGEAVAMAVALALVHGSAFGQNDLSKVEVKPVKVGGNVHVLYGQGGNIGVSAGPDGILIVDDQFAPLAPKIKAALKGIADAPLRFVLNTHFHFDHTGGNEIFGREAPIVAHEGVRARLQAGSSVGGSTSPPAPVFALPVITFKDQVSIHFNGEEIRAIHLPHGHTDTDSAVLFTGSKVVHMGDHYFQGRFPFVDLANGGSVAGVIANVERVLSEVPADFKVIPGHGEVTGIPELKAYVQTLKDARAVVEVGLRAGKTVDQLKKEKVLARWDKLSWQFIDSAKFTEILAKDLEAGSARSK